MGRGRTTGLPRGYWKGESAPVAAEPRAQAFRDFSYYAPDQIAEITGFTVDTVLSWQERGLKFQSFPKGKKVLGVHMNEFLEGLNRKSR